MKLSLASLAMLSIGLTFAAPSPMPDPKGPASGTVGQASQSCGNSISQSSLHCCTQNGNAGSDKSHSSKKTVKVDSNAYDMQCSAIAGDESQAVSSVCSVTVACCYGDGCVAIAY